MLSDGTERPAPASQRFSTGTAGHATGPTSLDLGIGPFAGVELTDGFSALVTAGADPRGLRQPRGVARAAGAAPDEREAHVGPGGHHRRVAPEPGSPSVPSPVGGVPVQPVNAA